jgi:hypothetical protein
VVAGQLSENRFGFLFLGANQQEVKHIVSSLAESGRQFLGETIRAMRLRPYISSVCFPQDGTRTEELWPELYGRLFHAFQPRTEEA